MGSEKIFENKVKSFLNTMNTWYIKYWAGAAGNGKNFTKDGIPDLLACIGGIFYGIEVKALNGKPSVLQLVNLRKIREAKGIGILLYPNDFEGFMSFIIGSNEQWYAENIELQNQWYDKLTK